MRKLKSVLVTSIPMATSFALFAQTPAPATPWAISILDKPQVQVEKILGKPTKVIYKGSEYDYKRAGFKNLGVMYGKGTRLLVLEIEFTKEPDTWEDALAQCKISTAGIEAKSTTSAAGSTSLDLTGIPGVPKKWSVTFFPAWVDDRGETPVNVPPKLSFYGPDAS